MSKKHSMDVGMAEANPAEMQAETEAVADATNEVRAGPAPFAEINPPEDKEHINPIYVGDDPMLGTAGTRSIYRWNNTGATVVHDFRPAFPPYVFTPVEFTGDEITSFVRGGDSICCGSEDDVQALLHKHKV